MKTNIFISTIIVFLIGISSVHASEIDIQDSFVETDLLSDIFETFWWESIENIELMEEFLSEYETIEYYQLENTAEFKELDNFIQNSIFK